MPFDPTRGLTAAIEWNQRGRDAIAARAYKYLSPTLLIEKDSNQAVELHSIALTNKPAIERMDRLAASMRCIEMELQPMADTPTEGEQKDPRPLLKELASLLGLDIDEAADPAMILQSIVDQVKAKGEGGKTMAASLRGLLDLPEDAPVQAITASVRTLTMVRETTPSHAELLLQPYVAKNVISPDCEFLKDDYGDFLALAQTNPTLCKRVLDQRAALLPPNGRTTAPPHGTNGSTARGGLIANAVREFDNGKDDLGKFTTKPTFINMRLRDAGVKVLDEKETEQYA